MLSSPMDPTSGIVDSIALPAASTLLPLLDQGYQLIRSDITTLGIFAGYGLQSGNTSYGRIFQAWNDGLQGGALT